MIAVIADDLTGAAELAGIGLDYQLKTVVNTTVEINCNADLLIIATDTRSLKATEAKTKVHELTRQVMALKPRLLYKKIDSVLRGHVLDEVSSHLEASGLKRALIIPGNPEHGKRVVNGTYYYKNIPVHLSNYSVDPDFPATSSNVRTMLRAGENLPLFKPNEKIPDAGIIVGEAAGVRDLEYWVEQADNNTIIAGASGLFNTLLKYLIPEKDTAATPTFAQESTSRLFVFGSTFHQGNYPIEDTLINNVPVIYLPAKLIGNDNLQQDLYESFTNSVVQSLKKHHNTIIAIHPDITKGIYIDPVQLTRKMGAIVNHINQQVPLHELLIEGGATAWAILTQLNISKLYPIRQLSPGVIRMGIAGNNQLCVTLKPGSYEWPAPVWETTIYS